MDRYNVSLEDVQKLLARKRLEVPSDRYFNQVLPEFHRRQAAVAERSIWGRLRAAVADVQEALTPRIAFQYSMPVLAAFALVALTLSGLEGGKSTSSAPMLSLELSEQPQGFAFAEGIPAAEDMPEFAIELDTVHPHYVMADSASGYDPALAF